MKVNGLIGMAVFFASMVLSSGAISDQVKVPQIYGQPYHKARKAIISEGWQPAQTVSSIDVGEIFGQAKYFFDLGYREINDCALTGAVPCVMYFASPYGKVLKVVTLGEATLKGEDFPVVESFMIVDSLPVNKDIAVQDSDPEGDKLDYVNFCEDVSGWFDKAGQARDRGFSYKEWSSYLGQVYAKKMLNDRKDSPDYFYFMNRGSAYAYSLASHATPQELRRIGRNECLENKGRGPSFY